MLLRPGELEDWQRVFSQTMTHASLRMAVHSQLYVGIESMNTPLGTVTWEQAGSRDVDVAWLKHPSIYRFAFAQDVSFRARNGDISHQWPFRHSPWYCRGVIVDEATMRRHYSDHEHFDFGLEMIEQNEYHRVVIAASGFTRYDPRFIVLPPD